MAATSSSPRALPWALKVFCRLGAGQPMIVRSRMKLGLSVTRWALRIASYRAGHVLYAVVPPPWVQSTVCTCQP